jgi:hypothetical protein
MTAFGPRNHAAYQEISCDVDFMLILFLMIALKYLCSTDDVIAFHKAPTAQLDRDVEPPQRVP